MKTAKKLLLFAALFAIVLSIPFTLSLLEKPQETRTRAATAASTLSFEPVSTGTNPIQKQVGDNIALDMVVNPGGTNHVSFVKFQIKYDPAKISIDTANPFSINTEAFPIKVEGPVAGNGLLGLSVSVGADPTKVIQTKTKVGTLNLKAVGGTNGTSTIVSFTNLSQVLSAGPNDNSYESVLQSTTPATIIIGGSGNITPGVTLTPSLTPQVSGPRSTITFDILLHGVGSAGDNPNPSGSSLSNKSPIHPQRELTVEIVDNNNKVVSTAKGGINYDASSGSFKGSIPFDSAVSENSYIIKIKTPRYLRRRIPDVQKITPGRDNRIERIDLVAGDTNVDNRLDILDYNAFLDCGYGKLTPLPNDDANSVFNSRNCQNHKPPEYIDINDDGIIDSIDYNLFLRELSVLQGD
jgi:hypothetical protein